MYWGKDTGSLKISQHIKKGAIDLHIIIIIIHEAFSTSNFRTLYIAVRYPKSFDLMLFYVICRPLELGCVDIETEDVPSSMDRYGKLYNNIIIEAL